MTTHRVLFTYEGWTNSQTEDFPLNRISSVQWEAGMLLGKLIIFASGNKAEFTQMDKANGKALADAIRMNIGATASVPTGTSIPAQTATEHPRESPSAPDPDAVRDCGPASSAETEAGLADDHVRAAAPCVGGQLSTVGSLDLLHARLHAHEPTSASSGRLRDLASSTVRRGPWPGAALALPGCEWRTVGRGACGVAGVVG